MDERVSRELASRHNDAPSVAQPLVQSETPDRAYRLKWLREVIISLTFSVFIIVFLYQPVKVEGTSMMPGLADQERIFINQFAYRLGPIKRGDVVVFRYPGDPSKKYIKRVVGEPGDRIEISRGEVFLNGNRLEEPYVPAQFRDQRSMSELIIPEQSYFVLGDHRNLSSDSRDFGPVGRKAIFGKAVFAYWPADMAGKLR
ncbi:MAG: signal peptidase I [Acidobacteria bacterium]|nr:MAG: signal peptidase I [Acidobacteriota bacterium]